MNRHHLTAGLVAVLGLAALAPGHAAAQSKAGPYFAVGAGYDDMPDRKLRISGFSVSSQWKQGYGGFAALGYKWPNSVRAEVEYSGRVAKVTTFNHTNPWAGTQWDNSVMLNALYDFDSVRPVTPYLGVGLGATQLQWGDNFRVPTQAVPIVYDGESIRLGWQGIAGLSYSVTPQVTLALDARIKGAAGGFSFPASIPGRSITDFKYVTRSVFVSVRYSFGAGRP